MDKEKLNKAAEDEAHSNYNVCCNDYKGGFIKGAEWLLSQPLCERLTEEEKEKIKAIYNRKTIQTMDDINKKFTEECLWEAIFEKELFNIK